MRYRNRQVSTVIISLLLLIPLLVACGESPTSTPVATTAASTTAVVTTAAPATTAAVTTAPAPTVGVTVTPTLAPATTAAAAQTTAAATPAGSTTPPAARAALFPVDPLSKADPDLLDILDEYNFTTGTPDEKLKAALAYADLIEALDESNELEFEVVLAKGAQVQPVQDKIKALGATVADTEEIVDTTYLLVTVPLKTFVTYVNPTNKQNFLRDLASFNGIEEINLPNDQDTEELRGLPATREALKDVLKATKNQGVQLMGIDKWHAAGFTGKGVTVGIIDSGYKFIDELKASADLPTDFKVMDFAQKLLDQSSIDNGVHGTAVSEIIHSVAPDAKLVATSIAGTNLEFSEALDYLVAQKVDIISISMGSNAGAEDGTSDLSRKIEQIRKEKGILFFLAAGNEGDEHYAGMYSPNDQGLHQWMPGVTRMAFGNPTDAPVKTSVILRWDQWLNGDVNPAATDLDLVIEDQAGTVIKTSDGDQRARTPLEATAITIPPKTIYYLKAKQKDGTPLSKDSFRLHIFTSGITPQFYTSVMSIGTSADSKGAIAVGAVDPPEGDAIGSYSSQGPLSDGRFKPEISGPAGVGSAAYTADGKSKFTGTSAATPEVAGMAAILKSANPALTADELTQVVLQSVKRPANGPNTVMGFGRADLTNIPPGPVTPQASATPAPAVNPNPALPLTTSTLYPAPSNAPAAVKSSPRLVGLEVDPSIKEAFATAFSVKGAQVQAVNFAAANVPEDVVSASLDELVISKGYTFALPGATKPAKVGNGPFTAGYYTSPGAPDILLLVVAVPADVAGFAFPPGIEAAHLEKLLAALKDQKSLVISLSGTDLLKVISN
jgi:subtilisin family serine protease